MDANSDSVVDVSEFLKFVSLVNVAAHQIAAVGGALGKSPSATLTKFQQMVILPMLKDTAC